jgi:hypothetical protein
MTKPKPASPALKFFASPWFPILTVFAVLIAALVFPNNTPDTVVLMAKPVPSTFLKLGASFVDAEGKPQEVEGEINNLAFDHQKNLIVPCEGRGSMIIAAKGIDYFIHGDADSFAEVQRDEMSDGGLAVSYSLTCQPDSADIVIEAIGAIPSADTP